MNAVPDPTIAACIVCRNEADRLVDCLASVDWVDEIVVVDLESEDGSADVARGFGARVVTHPPSPIVEPVRNVAAATVEADWILALDPDERVEPALARELQALSRRTDIDLVEIPFMHLDLGFPSWHPSLRFDPKPRMYRPEHIRWPDEPHRLPTHDKARTYRIASRDELVIRHERSRNLAEILDRARRYAPAQAQAMLDRGETFSARSMVSTLSGKAFRQFVVARPNRDGVPGLLRAGVLVHYHFCVWLEFWQLSGAQRTHEDDRYLARFDRPAALLEAVVRGARRLRRASTGPGGSE